MTFPDEYGEADLVQLAEVVRDWSHDPSGSYLVEARCRPTGRIFISGYHPKELDITLLRMVHCPHCKDWHRLVLAVEPIIREPIRLIRSSGA
ncbi:MAG: hypothetical protein WAU32_04215 [Thermoanaerobaculia bacterium]